MRDETTTPLSQKTVFVSAVDWWIAILLLSGPVICVVLTFIMLRDGRQSDALICLLAGAGTLLLTGILTIPCRYTLLDDTLAIRCGIMLIRVPLDQIKSIEPSSSWLSGPALSLRRVKISTASRFYLLSPKNREQFIDELSAAAKIKSS